MSSVICSHGFHWAQIDQCKECQSNFEVFSLLKKVEILETQNRALIQQLANQSTYWVSKITQLENQLNSILK